MVVFGSGTSSAGCGARATEEALERAAISSTAKLAIVFASATYEDLEHVPRIVRAAVGADVPIVGGTAGGAVVGHDGIERRGVSVVLIGGDDIEARAETARLESQDLLDVVPAARRIACAADVAASSGFTHLTCVVFAPSIYVDGEALVAAVRKGAGARAQMIGGLTGDDLTFDRPRVFDRGGIAKDAAVIAGLFTRKPIGVAARHGFKPVGPEHTVTRAEGTMLLELDGRPALDVWLEDVRRLGGAPPSSDLALFLANHWELGIVDRGRSQTEPLARAPFEITERGIRLSGSVGEGLHVKVLHATRRDLLSASLLATNEAVQRAGGSIAGALVFPCSGRLATLAEDFPEELSAIRKRVAAPIGGACVYGEIAKNGSDSDAFFNTTTVVAAFAA
jgi:hypothetical protein